MDLSAASISLRLATATTLLLAGLGLPLAWWIAARGPRRGVGGDLVEAACALPLVLPPTVAGWLLLLLLAPRGPVGRLWAWLGGAPIPFTFGGILVAAVITNLPFSIGPYTAAFRALDRRLLEAAWCLGESRVSAFRRVVLPACFPGIAAGLVMTFAHVVGEFGVVLMVGGNVPGVTRTLSVALYDDVQALDHDSAARTAGLLVAVAVAALVAVRLLERRAAPEGRGAAPGRPP
ncbi:MAG: molybdate ABC transporter permease subunit [Planctomycetaceae bacterium]